jgi:ligand-binding sensor domain-containing protein
MEHEQGWRWVVLVLVLSTAVLAAQESTHRFQHLTLKDGLPNPSVLDIR